MEFDFSNTRFVYRTIETPAFLDDDAIESLRERREEDTSLMDIDAGIIMHVIDRFLGEEFALAKDPDFRRMLKDEVENSGYDIPLDDQYFDKVCEIRDSYVFEYHYNECAAIRILIKWMLHFNLECMDECLKANVLDVGCGLLPEWHCEQNWDEGCRTSLLGIAAIDCKSVNAVSFLLKKGADPSQVLNKHPCDVMGYQCGASAVAACELSEWHAGKVSSTYVSDESKPTPDSAIEIIELLLKAGCDDGYSGYSDYCCHKNRVHVWTPEHTRVYDKHHLRLVKTARQKVENVVAITGIVSAWRRMAASPDSQGMQQAAKRFQSFAE